MMVKHKSMFVLGFQVLGLVLPVLFAGCMLEADRSSVRLKTFFEPPTQPDLSCAAEGECLPDTSTYRGVIQRYDRLKQEHSTYIRKQTVGTATDGVPVHAYYFAPEGYENTVLVTAGLHGNEKMGVWALLFFLRILAREAAETPALRDL